MTEQPTSSSDANATDADATIRRWSLDVILAIVLGLAAVTAAWVAFQSSAYGGEVTTRYNEGIRATDLASQAYTEGNQNLVEDQGIFLEYVKAAYADDADLASYIRENLMSDDLASAIEWWETEGADFDSPFVEENPNYVLAAFEDGAALDEEANAHFAAAEAADQEGAQYDLLLVILAVVLFLLGMVGVVRGRGLRLGLFGVGAALFALSLVNLALITFT